MMQIIQWRAHCGVCGDIMTSDDDASDRSPSGNTETHWRFATEAFVEAGAQIWDLLQFEIVGDRLVFLCQR